MPTKANQCEPRCPAKPCTNCWKHKAVLTNVSYQYFDGTFKFGPVCVDCFDIDEFNKSTGIFIGRQ